ncbi:MAG: PilN domain-containing protein [bacterium]|nr:PilN domain-containing protein [bacterium]
MLKRQQKPGGSKGSFLPEDYLARKAERRTNIFAVTMFTVVMFGVIGAFFVTNRQWNDVHLHQRTVNVQFAQAAENIKQLEELEQQKAELLEKADLTTALVEPINRSVLLAEIINRAPARTTILEIELESKRLDRAIPRRTTKDNAGDSLTKKSAKSKNKKQDDEAPVILAPRYESTLAIVGVVPRNTDVARYLAALQRCELLRNVEMIQTEKTTIREREVFKFRIEAGLNPSSDASRIEPLLRKRMSKDQIMAIENPDGDFFNSFEGGFNFETVTVPTEEDPL